MSKMLTQKERDDGMVAWRRGEYHPDVWICDLNHHADAAEAEIARLREALYHVDRCARGSNIIGEEFNPAWHDAITHVRQALARAASLEEIDD